MRLLFSVEEFCFDVIISLLRNARLSSLLV